MAKLSFVGTLPTPKEHGAKVGQSRTHTTHCIMHQEKQQHSSGNRARRSENTGSDLLMNGNRTRTRGRGSSRSPVLNASPRGESHNRVMLWGEKRFQRHPYTPIGSVQERDHRQECVSMIMVNRTRSGVEFVRVGPSVDRLWLACLLPFRQPDGSQPTALDFHPHQ